MTPYLTHGRVPIQAMEQEALTYSCGQPTSLLQDRISMILRPQVAYVLGTCRSLVQKVVDLSMAGMVEVLRQNGSLDAAIAALTEKLHTVAVEVTDQIDPFHEIRARARG